MAVISVQQLLEAGAHFGHQTQKWNPKMKPYIYTVRNNIHIMNLEQTTVLIDRAYEFLRKTVAKGKNVLFVGTKKQAEDAIKTEAERCGSFYVNSRWLGGTLTNFNTIRAMVDRMNKLFQMEKVGEFSYLSKRETSKLMDERDKLQRYLSGIADMKALPSVVVVVDTKKEKIVIKEAKKLGIPVIGVIDTNCDPDDADYVIPVNDDASKSVQLVLMALADAVIEGKEGVEIRKSGKEDDALSMEAVIQSKQVFEDKEMQKDKKEKVMNDDTDNTEA
ncbi:MAG: 30S ribosomal protein S2 [Christensenellaceae bacterium]|jgi:small subunit ribosomal protein S2|nr:30S ribosomal protein S2 [Christensenellaceae bacterium]